MDAADRGTTEHSCRKLPVGMVLLRSPKIAANRCFMDSAMTGVGVNASNNVDSYSPPFSPSREEPAVEIT